MTVPDVDWGALAHKAAAEHVAACEKALDCREGQCEAHDPDDPATGACPMPDTAGPFCYCTTCTIRESLHAAWPVIEQAARAGAFGTPRHWPQDSEPGEEQFAAWLATASDVERVAFVRLDRRHARAADRCWIENHERQREHLLTAQAEIARLSAEVERLSRP